MTSSTLRSGSTLKGSDYIYHIEKILGQGSFGITYLATTRVSVSGRLGNIETEIKVAVKEFFMKEFSSRHEDGSITEMSQGTLVSNYAKKFRKEADNLAKLQHPNIVNVLEVFDANNTCYYSMQYMEGGSLDEYVRSKGGLPEDEAKECIRQIGEAVCYMHEHKMLHLDLKPSNVMRSSDGKKLVLIDFGLSKQYAENGIPESSTTIGLGTPGYAPLEQSSADRDKDFAPTLDVYALGATYFKLLTGKTPPKASDVLDEGIPTDALRQQCVRQISIIAVERAMEPRKSKRLKSVSEFLSLLDGSEEDEKTDIKPPQPPVPEPPVPPSLKPKRSLWIAIAAAAVAAVLCVVLIPKFIPGENDVSDVIGDVSEQSTSTINGYEYVDLGLPSGLLWATRNVGASSPSDYGDYYAWGETSTKSRYVYNNVKYHLGKNSSNDYMFSKYCTDSKYGTFDNRTRLDLSDDAANANWGGSWRMPTKNEWIELKNNCTWTWTSQGGHNGYKVTGKNGSSIFLPAAGWRDGDSLYGAGEYGYYWSSSLRADYSCRACLCFFSSGSVRPSGWGDRCYGRSVRPVSSSL